MHIDIEPPYLVVKPGLSEDDFYRLAGEDSDWEFLDGRIIMHSPASRRHEDLFLFLAFLGALPTRRVAQRYLARDIPCASTPTGRRNPTF